MTGAWIIFVCSWILFLFFQAQGIVTGDSGDLVTAAAVGGVPHPPGYPLYTLLGFLLSKLPWLTVSWRVTLISSLSHAATLALVYALIYRLTRRNAWAGVFGAMALGTNYLFFLYSVTPEVFALFDLFVVLVWYLLFVWRDSGSRRVFFAACAAYGLSVFHHQMMLFFAPSIGYFVWMHRRPLLEKKARDIRRMLVLAVAWGAFGLLPYLYVPIAARLDPIINWDRAVTPAAFMRLISRADYGTFVSGGSFGQTLYERMLALSAYGTFFVTDWTVVGVIFLCAGLYAFWRKDRTAFWTWTTALCIIGPLFLFYASFPLTSRFTLGTYERFLLPGYVIIAVVSGIGFSLLQGFVRIARVAHLSGGKRQIVLILFSVICMIYPLSLGGITLWRFWGLPNDRTAENLGRDMLAGVSHGGVVLLFQDTALFTTQYVRYAMGVRSDTAVIHGARLSIADYQTVLRKHFPHLIYPDTDISSFAPAFIKANTTGTRRVYSNITIPVGDGWYWVPRGLLYEAVPFADLPNPSALYRDAVSVESLMHDPGAGILGRYQHLMLSDILDVYATGRIAMGKTLVRAGMWAEAQREFAIAAAYNGDTSSVESYELLGLTKLYAKDCPGALTAFREAEARSYVRSAAHIRLQSMTYGDCLGDIVRAQELFSEYEQLKKSSEQSLDTL